MNNPVKLVPADENRRNKSINELRQKYHFLKAESIGQSQCKREITALSMGNLKNKILFCAGIHASEWINCNLMMLFTRFLCKAVVNKYRFKGIPFARILRNRGITIIPCLNPDGVEIALYGAEKAGESCELVSSLLNRGIWQANASGVDLNHNFPAGWEELHKLEIENGITSASNTRYGGKESASEAETQAIMNLCRREDFKFILAFHSQGEEIYYDYADKTPEDALRIAKLLSKSSGYSLGKPEGLAVGGGLKDWFIEEFNRPGFTIETGKGQNPLPIEDLPLIYKRLEYMMSLCLVV